MKGARNYTCSVEHGLLSADSLTFRLLELLVRNNDYIILFSCFLSKINYVHAKFAVYRICLSSTAINNNDTVAFDVNWRASCSLDHFVRRNMRD